MPPLRELTDDLPSASALYLNKLNSELSKHISGFETDALKILCDYDWPDNFLQLKRVLSDVVIHTTGNYIQADCVKEILAREMIAISRCRILSKMLSCQLFRTAVAIRLKPHINLASAAQPCGGI